MMNQGEDEDEDEAKDEVEEWRRPGRREDEVEDEHETREQCTVGETKKKRGKINIFGNLVQGLGIQFNLRGKEETKSKENKI